MEFFSGLDVSIDETAICVVDDKGTVHLQTAVATDPEAIVQALKPFLPRLRRVGHEAGSLVAMAASRTRGTRHSGGVPGDPHVRAAMSAQRNKTDAADALGHAHIMRTGWFRRRIIKTEAVLPDAASLVAAAQSQAQISRSRKQYSPLAEGIRHPLREHRAWRLSRRPCAKPSPTTS